MPCGSAFLQNYRRWAILVEDPSILFGQVPTSVMSAFEKRRDDTGTTSSGGLAKGLFG